MKRLAVKGSLLAAVLSAIVTAPPRAAEAPSVGIVRDEGVTRLEVVIPAGLLGYAAIAEPDGTRTIYLLGAAAVAADAESPAKAGDGKPEPLPPCDDDGDSALTLYRVETEGPGRLVELRSDIPSDCRLDGFDIDADGFEELLLQCDDRWYRLDREARRGGELPPPILEGSGSTAVRAGTGTAPLHAALPGRLLFYALGDETGELGVVAEVELPLQGRLRGDNLWIGSPEPTFFGRTAGSKALFATAPRPVGRERLSTTLIEVQDGGSVETTECWMRLPGPEFVLDHGFLMLDGQPVLVVTTQGLDKLSLFGEKLLRIYPLRADRSRHGVLPLFNSRTRMNLWQETTPRMVDVNRDDRGDLVLGYWKGLKDDRSVLDVYLRDESGDFQSSPRTTSFDVKNGNREFLFYGDDLDGDDLPDLLLRAGSSLNLYRGLASADGKKLVDRKPLAIPIGESPDPLVEFKMTSGGTETSVLGLSRPRLIDLDGDGRPEIVVARDKGNLPGTFRAIWLEP